MKEYNVLILSAGRRVELVELFKKASSELNLKSNIIVEDNSDYAPAKYFADKSVKLPPINNNDYINDLIKLCNKENISIIIPTIDTNLLLLSKNKEYIEKNTNSMILISDYSIIKICRDKIKTNEFLLKNKFGVPKVFFKKDLNNYNFNKPLFIKPINGSSSVNTFKITSKKDLENALDKIENPIIQEFIEGEEYTVDIFLDLNSKIISVVPRLRIATRGGEISKGKIIKDFEIINDIKRLMKVLKPIGQITVQLIKSKEGIKYIEINPRFGGGAPMSIKSGANSCKYIYKLLQDKKLDYYEDYLSNIVFLRYDNSICINKNLEVIAND